MSDCSIIRIEAEAVVYLFPVAPDLCILQIELFDERLHITCGQGFVAQNKCTGYIITEAMERGRHRQVKLVGDVDSLALRFELLL